MTQEAATGTTLVSLWRDNQRQCKGLAAVLIQARAGDLPGVGDYQVNYGFPVLDADRVLAAIALPGAADKGGDRI